MNDLSGREIVSHDNPIIEFLGKINPVIQPIIHTANIGNQSVTVV